MKVDTCIKNYQLMSARRTPPPPMAADLSSNLSWSPTLNPIQEQNEIPSLKLEYSIVYKGRFIRQKEIVSPQLLLTIKRAHYIIRCPSATWWIRVEDDEERNTVAGNSFLCRRDEIEYDALVIHPTEDEIPTLKQKKRFLSKEMGYYRTIPIICDYGSSYDGNGRWTRYSIAYLPGEEPPYSFKKDCRVLSYM